MEASEPKRVNPNDVQHGVNSLRVRGPQIYNVNKYIKLNILYN